MRSDRPLIPWKVIPLAITGTTISVPYQTASFTHLSVSPQITELSTLAQVLACCLTTPSQFLNQCCRLLDLYQTYSMAVPRQAWCNSYDTLVTFERAWLLMMAAIVSKGQSDDWSSPTITLARMWQKRHMNHITWIMITQQTCRDWKPLLYNSLCLREVRRTAIRWFIVPLRGTSELGLTASVPLLLWWEFSFYLGFKSS